STSCLASPRATSYASRLIVCLPTSRSCHDSCNVRASHSAPPLPRLHSPQFVTYHPHDTSLATLPPDPPKVTLTLATFAAPSCHCHPHSIAATLPSTLVIATAISISPTTFHPCHFHCHC